MTSGYSTLAAILLVLCSACISHNSPEVNARRPKPDEMKFWLRNMRLYHAFTDEEIIAATGMSEADVREELFKWDVKWDWGLAFQPGQALIVLPYPGGRHPRIGFQDGAVDPQRETKISVFCPWDVRSYVVVDVPEAIWSNLGLTYLAHTHVPTIWSKQGITLPKLEWNRRKNGTYDISRTLPNGIAFGVKVRPTREAVRMEMWLKNGTKATLSDLRVQMCAMLKGAAGFTDQTNDNKLFSPPCAAVHDKSGSRWIIFTWEPIYRTWGNSSCPCLHADPKFPDCPPGETKRIHGWLSFYEGNDIQTEMTRIHGVFAEPR